MKTISFKLSPAPNIIANKKYNVSDKASVEMIKANMDFEIHPVDESNTILSMDQIPIAEYKLKNYSEAKKNKDEQVFEEIFDTAKCLADDGILFDQTGVLWRYNKEKFCYELCDKTDISNIVATRVNVFSALSPLYKVAFENAIKMVGRERANIVCVDYETKYKYSVQFKNILYDGLTNKETEVSKNDFVHNAIPFSPKDIITPRLNELFNQWTNGKAEQLKDIIAYSCIPNNTQKLIFFYLGQRNSGKSQFMGVMKRFLGEHNCTSTNLGILADQSQRFELINLRNKLAAFVSEIDEKTTYNTAILKRLSGNDDIRGEYKGVNGTVSFRFGGKVHIITNSLPTVADENDYAYFARTVIIDFPNTFPNSDVEVLDTIPANEYDGLADYCLNRIRTWFKARKIEISQLEPVDLRAKKYLEKTDYMGSFISKHMEMSEDFEPDTKFKINSSTFSSMFNEFLLKHGQKEWDIKRVGRVLLEKFPRQIERHQRRIDVENRIWEYRGIRLKEQEKLPVTNVTNVTDISSSPLYIENEVKPSVTMVTSMTHNDKATEDSTPKDQPTFPLEVIKSNDLENNRYEYNNLPLLITHDEASKTFGAERFSHFLINGIYAHYTANTYKRVN